MGTLGAPRFPAIDPLRSVTHVTGGPVGGFGLRGSPLNEQTFDEDDQPSKVVLVKVANLPNKKSIYRHPSVPIGLPRKLGHLQFSHRYTRSYPRQLSSKAEQKSQFRGSGRDG